MVKWHEPIDSAQKGEGLGERDSFINNKIVPKDRIFRPQGGSKERIRILPPWSQAGIYMKRLLVNFKKGGAENNTFISPEFLQSGTDPFYNAYVEMRPHSKEKAWAEDINKVRPSSRWYANVLVYKELEKGPQLMGFGQNVYNAIMAIVNSGEYGVVCNPENGIDWVLHQPEKASGNSMPMIYAARKSSALPDMNIISQIFNLDEVWNFMDLADVDKIFRTVKFTQYVPYYVSEKEDEIPEFNIPSEPSDTIPPLSEEAFDITSPSKEESDALPPSEEASPSGNGEAVATPPPPAAEGKGAMEKALELENTLREKMEKQAKASAEK